MVIFKERIPQKILFFFEMRIMWSPRDNGGLPLGRKTGILLGEIDFYLKKKENVEDMPWHLFLSCPSKLI